MSYSLLLSILREDAHLSSSEEFSVRSVKFCRDLVELSAERRHGQVTPTLHGFHCEHTFAVVAAYPYPRPVHL